MIKKRKVLLLFICVLFIYKGAFSAADYEVLKGINRLRVSIEFLNDEARKIGLTRDRLRTVTELRLRKEGIAIFERGIDTTFEGIEKSFRTPIIYVNVSVLRKAFSVSLKIQERVSLYRDESIKCRAATWIEGVTGTYGSDPEYIVTALENSLDIFLNDYYKANPKKKD